MKKKKRKRKISILKVLIVFLIIYLIFIIIHNIITIKIKNIYIIGNTYLTDKYIIEKAQLEDYPPFFLTTTNKIKKNLKKDNLIYNVKIKKTPFQVYLYIEENTPLFYDNINKITILKEGTTTNNYNIPILKNKIKEELYDEFINKMKEVTVLNRISELEYKPNEVDNERFYLKMTDGNSVYLTLNEFLSINDYISLLKTLNGKKGILYLDSGNYFEVKE